MNIVIVVVPVLVGRVRVWGLTSTIVTVGLRVCAGFVVVTLAIFVVCVRGSGGGGSSRVFWIVDVSVGAGAGVGAGDGVWVCWCSSGLGRRGARHSCPGCVAQRGHGDLSGIGICSGKNYVYR